VRRAFPVLLLCVWACANKGSTSDGSRDAVSPSSEEAQPPSRQQKGGVGNAHDPCTFVPAKDIARALGPTTASGPAELAPDPRGWSTCPYDVGGAVLAINVAWHEDTPFPVLETMLATAAANPDPDAPRVTRVSLPPADAAGCIEHASSTQVWVSRGNAMVRVTIDRRALCKELGALAQMAAARVAPAP
jgi:hypothetical protein